MTMTMMKKQSRSLYLCDQYDTWCSYVEDGSRYASRKRRGTAFDNDGNDDDDEDLRPGHNMPWCATWALVRRR
jgi:hypothetical protein